MSNKVIDFQSRLEVVGDNHVFPVSLVAENAASVCTHLVCIGYNAERELEVFASHGAAESFLLASLGVRHLLNATGRVSE